MANTHTIVLRQMRDGEIRVLIRVETPTRAYGGRILATTMDAQHAQRLAQDHADRMRMPASLTVWPAFSEVRA